MYVHLEDYMSAIYTRSYVQELERLVLQDLLPIYEKWHKEHGLVVDESKLPKDLIKDVKRKNVIAALLKPPQILA